jgi:hypothetical protein
MATAMDQHSGMPEAERSAGATWKGRAAVAAVGVAGGSVAIVAMVRDEVTGGLLVGAGTAVAAVLYGLAAAITGCAGYRRAGAYPLEAEAKKLEAEATVLRAEAVRIQAEGHYELERAFARRVDGGVPTTYRRSRGQESIAQQVSSVTGSPDSPATPPPALRAVPSPAAATPVPNRRPPDDTDEGPRSPEQLTDAAKRWISPV